MTSTWAHLVVDARDPARLAHWWAEALGYRVVAELPHEVRIAPPLAGAPGVVFVPVPEEKRVKNRLHLGLRPADQEAEVERLVDMGARHVDVGPGPEDGRVVLADPEGNEFCLLRATA